MEQRMNAELEDGNGYDPLYHVSCFTNPAPHLPVVTNETPDKIQLMRWGLIPFWSKEEKLKFNTANAKSEDIDKKPTWRGPVKSKRCLVPSDGFYEWRHIGKDKYPYRISVRGSSIFTLAGIWDTWTSRETGEIINSFSIITTEANPLMAQIHNSKKRMPVIFHPETEKLWLDTSVPLKESLKLLQQFPETEMGAHTIRKDFFRLGGRDKIIADKQEYADLPPLN